jgi:hypothetical protein
MKKNILFYFGIVVLVISSCRKDPVDPSPEFQHFTKQKSSWPSDIAHQWMLFQSDRIRALGMVPAASVRYFAYSGLALYESIVPAYGSHGRCRSVFPYFSGMEMPAYVGEGLYPPASANAAFAELLRKFTTNPGFLKAIDSMEAVQKNSYSSGTKAEDISRSEDYGRLVAGKVNDWSRLDGTFLVRPPYVAPTGPGLWEPTPPGYFPPAGAYQGELRPFLKDVVSRTSTLEPPVFDPTAGSEFYRMTQAVIDASKHLSHDDTLMVNAWRDILGVNLNTPSHMTKLLASLLAGNPKFDLLEAAMIYTENGVALNDAIITCFQSKYHYNLLRPVTYIRKYMGLANWNSVYPTPQHPAYPAVAPTAAAASVEVMEAYLGHDLEFEDRTQEPLYGVRKFGSFDDLLTEVGRSRTVSGINYPISVWSGISQGRQVGRMALQIPFMK